MKTPLRFQVTEFDCGTVALLNAFSYLFDREDIPAELVRAIHSYTLDCYDDKGNLGQGGTSREAVNMLAHWIENFTKVNDFKVKCKKFTGEEIDLNLIKLNVKNGAVILMRSWLAGEHYVIITNVDEEYVYIFDSYYVGENYFWLDKEVEIILDKPFSYNRKVKIDRLMSEKSKNFSLGPINKREILVINRTK